MLPEEGFIQNNKFGLSGLIILTKDAHIKVPHLVHESDNFMAGFLSAGAVMPRLSSFCTT